VDSFDTDALIYAAIPDHPLGMPVRSLFVSDEDPAPRSIGIGSVLLLPELLAKPMRLGLIGEVESLGILLARLELREVDLAIADLAVSLGSKYRLRAADAVHLATAVLAGADRFITNNRKDFSPDITEIDITHPEDLEIGDLKIGDLEIGDRAR
jgi:predicted nucleic acid-binding protein